MRAFRYCALVLLAVALVLPQAALSAQRIVLLESFTNVSCPPCATYNPITAQFIQDYGSLEPIQVINVQYHMSWPSPTDPFYLMDIASNDAARTYYGISAVPDLITDGENKPNPGDYDAMVDAMDDRLAVSAPFEISLTTSKVDGTFTIDASVTAVETVPAGDLVLRMAIVEGLVLYDTPPGSNGETEFHCSMRTMLPGFAGTPLTITSGQTLEFSESATLDPEWGAIYAVVWIQNNTGLEVLQAARTFPDFDFQYTGSKLGDITALGEMASLSSQLANTGVTNDSYDIYMTKDLPDGWAASVCIGVTCYPPFITEFAVDLASQTFEEVLVDITPLTNPGSGTITMTVISKAEPSLNKALTFKVVSDGFSVLVVQNDGGSDYADFFTAPIGTAGWDFITYDWDAYGKVGGDKLAYYDMVVWFTGTSYSCIDEADRAAIATYLDGGGRLFMTGQDIGYAIYEAQASVEGQEWYHNYLGAEYISDEVSFREVEGVTDDPISDGLVFAIEGGDGANNQSYPSKIEPFGDGLLCMQYNQQASAGVHLAAGTFKTVYFAFGFEGIATQADRDLVMSRVLAWLAPDVADVPGDQVGRAFLASTPRVSPNPFNPCTKIKFDVGGTTPTVLKITVFDVRGRLVTTLHDGLVTPGPQSFTWDGKDAGGQQVGSGIYLAQVRLADQARSFKMTLTK